MQSPSDIGKFTGGLVPKISFASGDALGTVRVWNVDLRESIFSLKKPEANAIRNMCQVKNMLIVVEGEDNKPSSLVVWSLNSFKVLQIIDNADLNDIDKIVEIKPFFSKDYKGVTFKDKTFFTTAGKSNIVKVWMISEVCN